MYFRFYGLRRTWLDICMKTPALEDPLTGNMGNGSEYVCNVNSSSVTIFSDHFKGK